MCKTGMRNGRLLNRMELGHINSIVDSAAPSSEIFALVDTKHASATFVINREAPIRFQFKKIEIEAALYFARKREAPCEAA